MSDVATDTLPTENGEPVRIVVTADNHLSAYAQRLTPSRLAERRSRLCQAFKEVIDGAIARRAHLFIQAGDLFDNLEPLNRDRAFVAEQLARLASSGIQSFAVSGNHDTSRQTADVGGASPLAVYQNAGLLHYFSAQHTLRPVLVTAANRPIAIMGLSSNPTAAPGSNPLDAAVVEDTDSALARSVLGILVLHAQVEGFGYPAPDESVVERTSIDAIAGVHLVLAGHIHGYECVNIGAKTVISCGATENMEFGDAEDAPGYAYIEVMPDRKPHVEHIPIKPQPRHVSVVATTNLWPVVMATNGRNGGNDEVMEPTLYQANADSPCENGHSAADMTIGQIENDVDTGLCHHTANGRIPGVNVHGDSLDSESNVTGHQCNTFDEVVRPDVVPSPGDMLIARVKPFCTGDAMVRVKIEGSITRDQYHTLDLRRLWFFGQQHAFSFEVDEL